MAPVPQWSIWETTLSASQAVTHPYPEGDAPFLQVTFTHVESGASLHTEGYWDGDMRWGVRFAPPQPGTWNWVASSPDRRLDGASGQMVARAATGAEIASNPNLRGHVRPDAAGRWFAHADGTPFFLLADTNWAMNTRRCGLGHDGDGPFYTWLRHRREAGFTAVFTEMFEIEQPNEGGHAFASNTAWPGTGVYSQLNPAFFQGLDTRMQALWEAGFVVAAHPTWVGKQVGMNPADALWISRYLLARYGAYNLIWSLSGEYPYSYTHTSLPWTTDDWRNLGRALQVYNTYGHPMSVHPSGRQELDDPPSWPEGAHQASSGGEFHDEPWLDHNWLQTGHALALLWRLPQRIAENLAREPRKPVLHAEGFYESRSPEGASARWVRWQAWTCFLDGAAGHAYGAEGVWQFFTPGAGEGTGRDRSNSQPWHGQSWREALEMEGGKQLAHLRNLLLSVDWPRLQPVRDMVRWRRIVPPAESIQAVHAAAIPGEVVIVYVPAGNSGCRLEVLGLGSHAWEARWYDPKTGEYSPAATGPVRGAGRAGIWGAPATEGHSDHVLLLTRSP